MALLLLLEVVALVASVASFNVDVNAPIVLNKPTPSSSSSPPTYFGFSALLQKSSAYIGAPAHEVP